MYVVYSVSMAFHLIEWTLALQLIQSLQLWYQWENSPTYHQLTVLRRTAKPKAHTTPIAEPHVPALNCEGFIKISPWQKKKSLFIWMYKFSWVEVRLFAPSQECKRRTKYCRGEVLRSGPGVIDWRLLAALLCCQVHSSSVIMMQLDSIGPELACTMEHEVMSHYKRNLSSNNSTDIK